MCMGVLPASISVCITCLQYLQQLEEGTGDLGTGATDDC